MSDLGLVRPVASDLNTNVGSPGFAHPDQLRGNVCKSFDIYSFVLTCIDVIWRISVSTPRDRFHEITISRRNEMLSTIFNVEKAKTIGGWLDNPKKFLEENLDCQKTLNRIFEGMVAGETAVLKEKFGELILQEPNIDELAFVGLDGKSLEKMALNSIGVNELKVPESMKNSIVAFGLYRANQLAFELMGYVVEVKRAAEKILNTIQDFEESDTDSLLRMDIGDITAIRRFLRRSILSEGVIWERYKSLAEKAFVPIDIASSNFEIIRKGKVPADMEKGIEKFSSPLELDNYVAKIEYYRQVATLLREEMLGCSDLVKTFYLANCRILNEQFLESDV